MPEDRPQSAVQATGQVASEVVSGLKQQPAMLAIVVLNVVVIVAAVWFLRELATSAKENMQRLLTIVERCTDGPQSPPFHRGSLEDKDDAISKPD